MAATYTLLGRMIMAIYIQLLTLTPEGRERALEDPESVRRAQYEINIPGIELLGEYGVLGEIDFVNIVQAPDNESIARFSLELGVRAGVHINTMPAIPISRLEGAIRREVPSLVTGAPTPEDNEGMPTRQDPNEGLV